MSGANRAAMTKPTLFRSAFAMSLAGAILLGCPASNETPADVCSDLTTAFRGYLEKCRPEFSPKRLDALERNSKRFCEQRLDLPGASNAGSGFRACAAQYRGAACNDFPECDLPPGELDGGVPCGDDVQCKSGRCLIADVGPGGTTPQCGHCAVPAQIGDECSNEVVCPKDAECIKSGDKDRCVAFEKAKAGERCGALGPECEGELVCVGSSGEAKCAPPGDMGAACSSPTECRGGLVCANGTCANGAKEGEACSRWTCGPQLTCDVTTGKCAKVTFVAEGGACDELTRICEFGSCEGGKCVAPVPEGGECGLPTKGRCEDIARCIDGKCVIPDPGSCR
jgi:hypothetical protein